MTLFYDKRRVTIGRRKESADDMVVQAENKITFSELLEVLNGY